MRTGKRLGLLSGNSSQVSQIALVSDQHDDNVGIGVISQLLEPSCDVFVGLMLADIVDEKSTNGTSIVSGSNGAVSLLSSGIPNLGLDRLGVDLNGSSGELDTDGRLGVQVELVTGESTEKVGLSDSRVSDQDDCRFTMLATSDRKLRTGHGVGR
jgi:hypothetical protein